MHTELQTYLESLKEKKVAVVGVGVSNRPLIELLCKNGISVTACDKSERESFDGAIEHLESLGAKMRLGAGYLDDLTGFDVIFRTPGMRPDVPALEQARAAGAEITSEMEVFFRVCPCTILAVTGSDGKTTTTTIIAGLLKAAGYRTFVGGNIGRPLLADVPQMTETDMAVLELSSFQLMTMQSSPHIAVVTNLSPNHLDIHKDMREYVDAKRNIYLHQAAGDKLIVNRDNDIAYCFASDARGEVTVFSRQNAIDRGVFLKNGAICVDGREVLPLEDILIPGVHNVENYMAAIAAVDGLVADEIIRNFARTFGGVEHRIELVRELGGVRYYNDSIASSPTRTTAGLRSFKEKVILIAGGYDKNIPYADLGPEIVEHVKILVLTGKTGVKIKAATLAAKDYAPGQPEIIERDDFKEAILAAHQAAQPGDVVILSPASASFDHFKNFMERGETFKKIVLSLKEK